MVIDFRMKYICIILLFFLIFSCGKSEKPQQILKQYCKDVVKENYSNDELILKHFTESGLIIKNRNAYIIILNFNEKIKKFNNLTVLPFAQAPDSVKDKYKIDEKEKPQVCILFCQEEVLPILTENGKIKSVTAVQKGEKVYWW